MLAERLSAVRERIRLVAGEAGRNAEDITLIAVSKTHSVDLIEQAYQLGLRHFGENRIEEAEEKIPALSKYPDITWHMIGHIQSRKVKRVPSLFSIVHSVDRVKVAEKLGQQASSLGKPLDVLLEVNVSGEESKHGFSLNKWEQDDQQLAAFGVAVRHLTEGPGVRLVGLMTMAPFGQNPEASRPFFASLARLRDTMKERFPDQSWSHLSMGMTGDFEVAIEEGATMVRIGTAIFGPRRI